MPGGAFSEAEGGFGIYGLLTNDFVCEVVGAQAYEGEAPACPTCTWAFDLGPIADSVAVGNGCDDVGVGDGWADGLGDYTWGFGTYVYEADGQPLYYEDQLMLYGPTSGWYPYLLRQPYAEVTGTPYSVAWKRMLLDPTLQPYYYYYYR
ncbi:MAG: hypothetical protein ACOZNI_28695 [Myxococcota bacterium]